MKKVVQRLVTFMLQGLLAFDRNMEIVKLLQKASIRLNLWPCKLYYPNNTRGVVPHAARCKPRVDCILIELHAPTPRSAGT